MLVDTTSDENLFRVHSETTDKTYIVDLEAGTCNCTDWSIKRNRLVGKGLSPDYSCKHMRAAQGTRRNALGARAEKIKLAAQADRVKAELLKSLND